MFECHEDPSEAPHKVESVPCNISYWLNSFLKEYKFYAEYQSHEPEFDYLKSLEIEEKINKIKWCKRNDNSHFLLTTNGKSLHFRVTKHS